MIKTAFLSVLSDGKAVFLCDRKFLPNYLSHKNLSEGCTARGREICLTAPLAREVCASTHFFNCLEVYFAVVCTIISPAI